MCFTGLYGDAGKVCEIEGQRAEQKRQNGREIDRGESRQSFRKIGKIGVDDDVSRGFDVRQPWERGRGEISPVRV